MTSMISRPVRIYWVLVPLTVQLSFPFASSIIQCTYWINKLMYFCTWCHSLWSFFFVLGCEQCYQSLCLIKFGLICAIFLSHGLLLVQYPLLHEARFCLILSIYMSMFGKACVCFRSCILYINVFMDNNSNIKVCSGILEGLIPKKMGCL